MNMPSAIQMDQRAAREALRAYRIAAKNSHRIEDQLLARGYRALAQGKQLIRLPEALAAAGQHENGYPKLAAIRADAEFCYVFVSREGGGWFTDRPWVYGHETRHMLRFPDGTFPPGKELGQWANNLRAIVPLIPPANRPAHSLANYVLLWEATWEQAPRPPRDPALLRQLAQDIYVVLATWELTDLERLVLGMREAKS